VLSAETNGCTGNTLVGAPGSHIKDHLRAHVVPIYLSIVQHVMQTHEQMKYIHEIITGGYPLPKLYISRFQYRDEFSVSVFLAPYHHDLSLWGGETINYR
jgi:hypothetical protein